MPGGNARADTTDYLQLFVQDRPLLDVRAPIEFNQGAFPNASNYPLLDNRQRELVGTRYREGGQDAAIALGLELATPELREQRLASWRNFCEQHPDGYLYCFRGGLRSHLTQQWLREASIDYPLVHGGYKALRAFLLDAMEQCLLQVPLLVVGGPTGAGKTALLQACGPALDLEALAQHRGSAFGATLQAQPAQISWENSVAIALLKHCHGPQRQQPLLVEDESRLIGRIWVPLVLQQALARAPMLVLETPLEQRIAAIRRDYIDLPWQQYRQHFGAAANVNFTAFVLDNLARIRKRLGGVCHGAIHQQFSTALQVLFRQDDSSGFDPGIRQLLLEYYDPMYEHLLRKRQQQICLRANAATLQDWLRERAIHMETAVA
jgi:tRNA 2-selenouridine synthase